LPLLLFAVLLLICSVRSSVCCCAYRSLCSVDSLAFATAARTSEALIAHEVFMCFEQVVDAPQIDEIRTALREAGNCTGVILQVA
jgi:hypothetical protein